jgi:hypothetical protein
MLSGEAANTNFNFYRLLFGLTGAQTHNLPIKFFKTCIAFV